MIYEFLWPSFFNMVILLVKYMNFILFDLSFEASLITFKVEFTKRLDELKKTLVVLQNSEVIFRDFK